MFNLFSPSELDDWQKVLAIRHRFYGDVTEEPLSNFFGLDAGANVNLAWRMQFPYNLGLQLEYTRRQQEKQAGIWYRIPFSTLPLQAQILVQFFSYQELSQTESDRQNLFYLLTLQNEPLWDRIRANINFGYDGYNERIMLGLGYTIQVVADVFLLLEYYPVLDRDSASSNLQRYIGPDDAFSLAVKLDTYGHHFIFSLTNTDSIGLRRAALGTAQDAHLRLGFNIERRF